MQDKNPGDSTFPNLHSVNIMNYPIRNRGGFTLVEIMIVVGIIALLAAMAIPLWQRVRLRSIGAVMDNDARQLASAAQQYYLETSATSVVVNYANGRITGALEERVQFIGGGYTSINGGSPLVVDTPFTMTHPLLSVPTRQYSPEGQQQP